MESENIMIEINSKEAFKPNCYDPMKFSLESKIKLEILKFLFAKREENVHITGKDVKEFLKKYKSEQKIIASSIIMSILKNPSLFVHITSSDSYVLIRPKIVHHHCATSKTILRSKKLLILKPINELR